MNIHRTWPRLVSLGAMILLLTSCAFWNGGLPPSYSNREKYPIIASIHGIKEVVHSVDLREVAIRYYPTNEITLNTNTTHGWRIQIKPAEKRFLGREFYILPKPAHWGAERVVSQDRTTCITSFIVPKGTEYLEHGWGMYADDPTGEYRIAVFLDDKFAADFKFNVVAGPKTSDLSKGQNK